MIHSHTYKEVEGNELKIFTIATNKCIIFSHGYLTLRDLHIDILGRKVSENMMKSLVCVVYFTKY